MICQLCLHEKTLIKKSHIVPNFLYKSLLSSQRRLVNINLSNLKEKTRYMQSGYSEGELLCADCDNRILGSLERYACNHIYSETPEKHGTKKTEHEGTQEIIPYIRYTDLDYTKTKLFFLSILWRCHIARNAVFSDVNLGHHAEKLRLMILQGDAGPDDEYEVVLTFLDTEGARPTKSVVDPRKLKGDGNTFYVFHINEIMYHFNISRHNKTSLFTKGAIRKDNIMDIALLKGYWARQHFDQYIGRKILMKSNIRH